MAFVSYDSYKNRIEKLAKFKNFVVKYKFLIIAVLAVIFGGAAALMATKGMITADTSLSSDTYVYGESYQPTAASAFLSDVGYEYTLKGKDEWTSEKPVKAGEYSVRAVSKKLIGKGYGKTVDYKILPAEITFTFTNDESATLTYGSDPASRDYNYNGLVSAYGDKVTAGGVKFEYTYPDAVGKDVRVELKKLEIFSGNDDRSDCYVYKTVPTAYKFAAKPISFTIDSENETYDGKGFSFKGKPNAYTQNQLVESDTFTIDTKLTDEYGATVTPVNAGSYFIALDGAVKVFDGKGNDISYRYEITGTPESGTFTVEQRPITLLSATEEWIYDGLAHSNENFTVTSGSLAEGQSVTASSDVSVTDVIDGRTANALTYTISAASGDVTSNYLITQNTGTLSIKPCPLNITTEGGEWEYDGAAHPVKQHTVSGLATGQQLANISYASEGLTDVNDSGKNTLNYSIVWGVSGEEVDKNNYNITELYGDIKITPRPLKVTTDSASRPYKGEYLTCDTFTPSYAGTQAGQTDPFINYGENLSIVGSLPRIINVGTKENAIDFAVPNNNYYIDETKTEYGTLEITQAEITVTLKNATSIYGEPLGVPEITISGEGIVNGELFVSDIFNPVFLYDGAAPSRLNKGAYTVSLDRVNSAFTYGNGEPVTTPNYKITSATESTLTVESRGITVRLNDTPVVYGDEIKYIGGYKSQEGLVEGQTVQVDASQVTFDIPSAVPNVDTYPNAITCPTAAITVLSDGTPVTDNYAINPVVKGTLTVNKREITVNANDMPGIIYGITPQYEVKAGNHMPITGKGLATGETLTINSVSYLDANGTPVDPGDNPAVGTYSVKPSLLTIKNADGTVTTGNYQITPETDGKLEIAKRPVKFVSSDSESLTYNGQAQFCKEFTKIIEEPDYYDIVVGHQIRIKDDYATVTDVSEDAVQNVLHYEILDSFGYDVTKNYDDTANEYGTLKVIPLEITVTLNSYGATYGESYAYATGAGNYDGDLSDAPVTGETLEVTAVTYEFGAVKYPEVREAAYWIRANENAFKVTKADGTTNSTANYQITPVDGYLEITKRNIRVTLETYSATYGEKYGYATGAGNYAKAELLDLATGNALVAGETLEITEVEYEFGAEQYPEVREEAYTVSLVSYTIFKSDKTTSSYNNYAVTPVDGALTITKRPIDVTLNKIATVTYGEPVTYENGGEKVENAIGECTVNFDAANLKFTPLYGYVNPDLLRLDVIEPATYTYPDAGSYNVRCEAKYITVLSGGNDVTHNYDVNVYGGILEITKREIKVKPTDCEIYYGDIFDYSKVEPNHKIIDGSLATFEGEQETLVIFVNSPPLDGASRPVGTYDFTPDRYTITKVDGTTDSYNNYKVEFEEGTLEIKKNEIDVELKDIILTYGEDDHSKKSYAELYADEIDLIAITYSETLKLAFSFTDEDGNPVAPRNVGSYGVKITNGETKNYIIKANGTGKLTIHRREIYPVPYDKTAEYGTTEFEYPQVETNASTNYDYDEENKAYFNRPAYNEKIEILVGYDINEAVPSVGKYNAICSGVKVYADGNTIIASGNDGNFETLNYVIVIDSNNFKDKLEITQKTLTITLNDIEVYYGDEIKYESDGTENVEGLLTEFGHEFKIDPNGISFAQNGEPVDPENVGKYDIVTSGTKFITILSGSDDVTENYEIKVTGGALTIKARPITVTIQPVENTIYYGEDLPKPAVVIEGVDGEEGLVKGDTFTAKYLYAKPDNVLPSRYNVGDYKIILWTNECEFTYANGAPSTIKNYEIVNEIEPVAFKITPRPITVTLNDIERVYGEISVNDFLTWKSEGDANIKRVAGNFEDYIQIGGEYGLIPDESGYEITWYVLDKNTGEIADCKNSDEYVLRIRSIWVHNSKYDREEFTFYQTADSAPTGHNIANGNYDVTIVNDATLTITRKVLTVEVGDKTTEYGNESDVLANWEFSSNGAFNEVVKVSSFALDGVTEHPVDVDTYDLDPKVFTAEVEGGSVDNYDITIEGKLIIGQREITVQLYDNEACYGEDFDYLILREGAYIGVTGGLVTVGEQTETLEITLVDYGFGDNAFPNASDTAYTVQKFECAITKVDGTTDGTGNYKINFGGGALTIKPRPITITLENATSVYREPLGVPAITVEGLVNDDEFNPAYLYTKVADTPPRCYWISLDEENCSFTYTNGAPSTAKNYAIETLPTAYLTVTPRKITITLKSFSIEYGVHNSSTVAWLLDNTTPSTMDVVGNVEEFIDVGGEDGLADGDEIYKLIWRSPNPETGGYNKIKDVGTYDLELWLLFSQRSNGEPDHILENGKISAYYDLTFEGKATLTVTPKKVDLDLGDIEVIYGDKDNALDGYTYTTTVEDNIPFEETIKLPSVQVVGGSDYRLNVGEYPLDSDYNKSLYTVYDVKGEPIDLSELEELNYIVIVSGKLIVKQREIEIELWELESVTYGERLEYPVGFNQFDILKGSFAYGQQLKLFVIWDSSIIDTGNFWWGNAGINKYGISRDFSIVYESDGETYANKDNYYFICADKEVEINPFEVVITPDSDTDNRVYDGTAYEYDATSFSLDKDLPYGESLEISVTYRDEKGNPVTKPTDAGTYYIYLDEITSVNKGTNADAVPENYAPTNDETVYGTLVIHKRDITVSVVENQKFVYGVEAVSPKFTAIGFPQEGVDAGRIFALLPAWEYSVDGEEWLDGDDLWINEISLDIGVYFVRSTDAIVTYDKHMHYDRIGKNHNVDYQIGTFEVIAREVRLVTNTRTDFVYNGDYQYDNGYTLYYKNAEGGWTEFTLPEDETVIPGEYTKIKNAGTVDNIVELTFPNYNVVETEWGKLTVSPLEITIESATASFVYDGKAHSAECYEVTSDNQLVGWHEIEVSNPATVTNVADGDVKNKLTYTIIDTKADENDEDRDVTKNYEITEVYGTLTVTPRPIVVVRDSASKEYDGTALTCTDYAYTYLFQEGPGAAVEEDGLLNGDEVYAVDGTVTELYRVGSVPNETEFKAYSDNYEVVDCIGGTLTVTERHVSIALISNPDLIYGEKTYSDAYGNFTLTDGSLADGDELKVAVKYSLKNGSEDGSEDDAVLSVRNTGTYTVYLFKTLSFVQTSYDDKNGLSNYVIDDCAPAEITISAKDVTVTLTGIDNKIYGEKFAGYDTDGYEPSEELPYGDTFEVYVKYSKDGTELEIEDRTDAGEYDVSLSSCIVRDKDGNDVTELNNYNITPAGDVKLIIEARKIIVVTGGLSQEYDGEAYSNSTFTNTYFEGDENKAGLLPGDENVLEIVNEGREVVNVADSGENDVIFASTSPNYEVAGHAQGELEIYAIDITVELWEITGTVYGTRLTYPDIDDNFGYADGSKTLLDGETLKIAVKFYTKNGNELGDPIDGEPKDAGSYYYVLDLDNCVVTGSLGGLENGVGNYNLEIAEKQEATIDKLDITLSLALPWNADEIVYNASQWALGAYDYEIVAGGVDGNCKFAYEEIMELAVDYYADGSTEPMKGAPVNAGTYTVKFNVANSKIDGVSVGANYEVADVDDISFTINAKDITITMSDESRVYNGKVYDYLTEYTANKFVSQPEGSDKIIPAEVSYNGTPKDADTYEVTLVDFDVEGGPKSNYNLLTDASKLSCNVVIELREITFTVEDWSIERGSEIKPELTIGGYGFVEGEELEPVFTYYAKDESGEWKEIAKDQIVKRGIYEVRVSFDDEGNVLANYDPTYNNGTLEVTGLKVVIVPEFNGEELVYNGSAISLEGFGFKHYHKGEEDKEVAGFAADDVPVYIADAEEGKPYYQLLFTNTETGESSYDAPVNAGEYEVAFVFDNVDEDKYAVYNNDTITITVAPRQVVVNIDYDENDFSDLSYTYELLPTASVSIADADITGNEKGILDCDLGLEVEWYFYNMNWAKEVEYNYAGNYSIRFRFSEDNGNYELVNPVSGVTFTVDKAVVYITPKTKPAVDYTHEGQTLSLAPDDYDIRSGMIYGDDVLTIEGSGVLKTTRSASVTIKNATAWQNGVDVTKFTYDIRYTYKANDDIAGKEDWYTRSNFTTTLMFNPVQISYRLVIDEAHKHFNYDGNAQDLGIDESEIANHVQFLDGDKNVISIAEAFSVGNYDLQYVLIPIIQVKVYDRWIRVLVFDQSGNNVTSLFQLNLDDSTDLIEVRGYDLDFNLTISDSDLEEAWANRDGGSAVITQSLYIDNGYYVLKSGYGLTGYTDGNHVGEVLVRKEDGKFVFKVIVYELNDKDARIEKSITYSLNVPEDLTYSVTLVTMGTVLRPDTTTTTQANTLATIGGYSL